MVIARVIRLRMVPARQDKAPGIHDQSSSARDTRPRKIPIVVSRVTKAKISKAEAVMASTKMRPGIKAVIANHRRMAVAANLVTQASAVTEKKITVDRSIA